MLLPLVFAHVHAFATAMTFHSLHRAAATLNLLLTLVTLAAIWQTLPADDALEWTLGSVISFLLVYAYMRIVYHPRHFDEDAAVWHVEMPDPCSKLLLVWPVLLGLIALLVLLLAAQHAGRIGWIVTYAAGQVAWYGSCLWMHGR